jgi:pimeloyl-ACP methyl ester carboxylesterase
VRESVRQGPEAFAWEQIDAFLPWGFRLADIAIEVYVFHGEQDTWVERRHVDFLVETRASSRLTVWPDSGHRDEAEAVLDQILGDEPDFEGELWVEAVSFQMSRN